MKNWFGFLFGNKRLLNFGFLFNFFSSFGQTFFISLFVPFWIKELRITNAAFGSMYATVTIISAFLLSFAGRFIDNMSLRRFGYLVFGGLAVAVVLLSQAYSVWLLMAGLLLVRCFGQGMMTHTASTGIAKLFDTHRGKALGITALGHPAGQFFLPLLVAPLSLTFGWRIALLSLMVLAAILMIPAIYSIHPVAKYHARKKEIDAVPKSSVNHLLTGRFWLIASNIFIVPFLCTAIFLYQYSIAESKGWEREWVTFSFAFFAVANAITLLLSGNLVDKYSGIKLFPLYIIPTFVALFLMAIIKSVWVFPLFYALLGISTGLGSTIKTAMQTEVYGKAQLGKIRSYFSTVLVFSTALGPPAFGLFLDRNFSFDAVMGISAIVVALIFLLSFRVWKFRQV
jgi:MFS family permease